MYNKAIIAGYLARDPELKYTPGGTAIANFTVAANSRYKSGGESKDEVLFMRCVVFGKQAENAAKYLVKGSAAIVDGRLRERKWMADGEEKSVMELVADTVKYLTKKKAEDAGGHAPEPPDDGLDPF